MWSIFIILVLLQILGNVYFSFNYINVQLVHNPKWLTSFQELVAYFVGSDISLIKIIISCLIGIPLPLISLFFLKSLLEYANPKEEIKKEIITPKIQKVESVDEQITENITDEEKRISSVVGNQDFRK